MRKVLFGVVATFVLSGCTDRLTDFTVISTRNVPIGNGTSATISKADKRVKGVDKKSVIFCIPIGSPNLKEAIDKAIEKYPGAIGLSDGVIKSKWWTCMFYGESSYVVEGTPIYNGSTDKISTNYGIVNTNNPVASPSQTSVQSAPQQENVLLFFHEVKQGESLNNIAEIYNVTVSEIIRWNNLSSTNIAKGTKLKIHVK